MTVSAPLYALAAAALFGLATPLAKLLIGALDPWLLAGLFYLAAGLGLVALRAFRPHIKRGAEAPLSRRDAPWLAGAIFFGGIVGPLLLMTGLARTDAASASLLLTLEGAATAVIAWVVFRESVNRRIAGGMALIVAGAVVLAWRDGVRLGDFLGSAAIVGACIAWAIDNNLTRKVSLADPVQIAMYKGLVAGPICIVLALTNGAMLPGFDVVVAAAVIGFLGYGISLVLFVTALRHLGTARTGAYFSTAPFIGAAAAIPLLSEPLSATLLTAGFLMGAGVWLHLTERHEHEHDHDAMEHEHRHSHDEHHHHAHTVADPPGEPHSHRHVHVRLRHAHAHMPDSHHRHGH